MLDQISSETQDDLFEIWQRIARNSVDLVNRIEDEFYSLLESLARMPVGTLLVGCGEGFGYTVRPHDCPGER